MSERDFDCCAVSADSAGTGQAQDQENHKHHQREYASEGLPAEVTPSWVIQVCRHCYSPNLTGARHELSLRDGPESATVGCLWPCNHEVSIYETECGACNPGEEAPF